jgi:predicted O-linked N-acetylglucosamine transferase (SPINDLY family)
MAGPPSMTVSQAFDFALQHHQAGRLAEAEALYRQILAVAPHHADALHLLGVIASQMERHDDAVEMIRRAIALEPNCASFHSNYGEACRKVGRLDEAIAAYRRALQLQPEMADFQSNLGGALTAKGEFEEAILACRRAIQLKPDFPIAWMNLAVALIDVGRFKDAVAASQRAIELRPDYAEARSNLGCALIELGKIDEAIGELRRALKLKSDLTTFCNLAGALRASGQIDEALACLRHEIVLHPGSARLQSFLILTLLYQAGDVGAAVREACRQWEDRHGAPLGECVPAHGNRVDSRRRLKVGYVSPNFSSHVVSRFLTPLLEAHDHSNFEIHCYASVKRPDHLTERLKKTADVWRDALGITDENLAARIRADGIDILVDLTMHCDGSRLLAFARKPAPVQVAWLAYPGSTGLRAMDYRLTDAHMEPEGSAWSESVEEAVRLPDSWFCYDPLEEFPPPGELPALKAGYVTFGSLNNFSKMNEAVLRCWAGVLSAVAGSKLVLRCPEGEAQTRVRRFFESHGIEAERVELVPPVPLQTDFLKLYQRIDLGLDPFPYTGGTTTCEALWMGVPVVTLTGRSAVARQTFSILSTIRLPELAADSEEGYTEIARTLADDLPRLAEMRATLRERMKTSALMDGPRFARNVERAYREMWRAWCAKSEAI